MIYVKQVAGQVTAISHDYPAELKGKFDAAWSNRNDWNNFAKAEEIAKAVTEFAKEQYLPVDRGTGCSPRFDIVRAPKVGDDVSYSFNGDSYPDGEVVRVSATFGVVTTSSGKRYYRKPNGASWCNGGWSLIQGHVYEQNPHF